jgi:hypothetical protein
MTGRYWKGRSMRLNDELEAAQMRAAYAELERLVGPSRPLDTSGPTVAELAAQMDLDRRTRDRAEALAALDAQTAHTSHTQPESPLVGDRSHVTETSAFDPNRLR